MSNQIEEKFLKNFDIEKKYVVALSGGVDSAVLAFLATKFSNNIRSIFINHNQQYSNQLEIQAQSIAEKLKINFIAIPTSIEPNSSETQMRKVRIEQLYKNTEDNEYILFGHTLSDRAETFLMNLFRGTRLHGLKSIPKNVSKVRRPLLEVSKEEIITYAKQNQIDYLDDESNLDNAINRNWIRNDIFKEVEKRFPGSLEGQIAQIVSELEYILPQNSILLKSVKSSRGYIEIPVSLVDFKNPEILSLFTIIGKAMGMTGMESKDLDKIKEAISTSKQVTFFNDWYCMSYSSLLIFINKNLWVQESGLDSNPYGYLHINTREKSAYFNNWNVAIPSRNTNILIRTLKDGDKVRTNNSEQKVSELMRAFGLRGLLKEAWPLILAEEEIIWIPGIRKSDTALDFQKNNYSHIISASIEKSNIENF
tara:strand:- start:481 stop:1749 length:1269 start_codon:yes stop_codon:yes gene_type:complete